MYVLPNPTLSISCTDPLGRKLSENMGEIAANDFFNSDTQQAYATQIDTFARAFMNLSNNTYNDSNLTFRVGITEILAD